MPFACLGISFSSTQLCEITARSQTISMVVFVTKIWKHEEEYNITHCLYVLLSLLSIFVKNFAVFNFTCKKLQ